MCSVPGLDLWLGCIFQCDEEYFSCSAVWFPCKFSGILRFQSGENWECSCNGEESLRTPLRTGSWTSRIWKMELSWRKAFLTRLVPMAQKRLMKWKLIGTRKGFLKAQRKPHPWLTCCVSIFEIFFKRTCRISWASISGSVHLQSNSPGLWDWIYLWLRLWWWLVWWWRPLGILSRQKCQFLWYS